MNQIIFYFLYSFAHQSVFVDNLIIFFAAYFQYLVIFGAGLFLLMHHEVFVSDSTVEILVQKRKEIFSGFITGGIAWALAFILKLAFNAQRPFEAMANVKPLFMPLDHAFPSGHATFFSALAFSIFFFHKKAGYIFMFFALVIGAARIVAGVHFPVDIVGGYILGFAVAFILHQLKFLK